MALPVVKAVLMESVARGQGTSGRGRILGAEMSRYKLLQYRFEGVVRAWLQPCRKGRMGYAALAAEGRSSASGVKAPALRLRIGTVKTVPLRIPEEILQQLLGRGDPQGARATGPVALSAADSESATPSPFHRWWSASEPGARVAVRSRRSTATSV